MWALRASQVFEGLGEYQHAQMGLAVMSLVRPLWYSAAGILTTIPDSREDPKSRTQ